MSPLDTIPPELRIWLPYAAIFLLVFAISFRSLRDFSIFDKNTSVVMAICVSLLGIFGMDQVLIRPLMASYSAMAFAMLIGLAVLLLSVWIGIIVKGSKRN